MKRIDIRLLAPYMLLLIVAIFIGVAMVKTQTLPSYPKTPPADMSAAIKNSLLGDAYCSLSCWQGITPGITNSTAALQILRNSSLIEKKSLKTYGSEVDSGNVTWDWKDSIASLDDKPRMSWRGGIVFEFVIPAPPNISIDEVVNRFGPPEKVDVTQTDIPEQPAWSVTLYYVKSGFEIQIYNLFGSTNAQLKSSDTITVILLFKPSTIEGRPLISSLETWYSNLRNWRGYGNIFDLYFSK